MLETKDHSLLWVTELNLPELKDATVRILSGGERILISSSNAFALLTIEKFRLLRAESFDAATHQLVVSNLQNNG